MMLSAALEALEMAPPEDRRRIIDESFEQARVGIEECSREYPEHSEQFQSDLGSWDGWNAVRHSAAFNFHEDRRHAEAACDHGFEAGCDHGEQLDGVDEFSMPPFGRDWAFIARLPDVEVGVDTFLISPRGIFDDTDFVVEADAFDDGADEAIAPLVENLDGDAVQLVPDAMTDASLVTTAADAFVEHGITPHVLVMAGAQFSEAAVLESKTPRDEFESSFGLHLTTEGILFYDLDSAAEVIDDVLDRFQLHEVYHTLETHQSDATDVGLDISVDEGLPAVAALRLMGALTHERTGAPFREVDHFHRARAQFDREQQRFYPLFEHIRLRSELVSAPEDGDGGERSPPGSSEDEPEVGDYCAPSNIHDVVKARSPAVQQYYERELIEEPQLSGELVLNLRIGLDGSVSNVEVEDSTLDAPQAEGCIARVFERMQFEEPNGGVCDIDYPFKFTPGGGS